ncbi:MAG: homoserine kinase [Pseudomonadota bacterium]
MDEQAARALAHWDLEDPRASEPLRRENTVYPICTGAKKFALRLHRPGYRNCSELHSELEWMTFLARAGLAVPTPVRTSTGALLAETDGTNASLLTWLPGCPMGATGTQLEITDRAGVFHDLGALMARLHSVSDAWERPPDFRRPSWDKDGLVGESPLWGRFWDAPFADDDARAVLRTFKETAERDLSNLHDKGSPDFGLIHADLLRENVLIDDGNLSMIDFDDSGWGYRLFDIATSMGKNINEPDRDDLKTALLTGYRSVRPIDTGALDLFMPLRACTYLGWIADRWSEPGAPERAARNLSHALTSVQTYLRAR